jgi:copper homeostasis protein
MRSVLLEICVEDLAGVEAAKAGGADRIELCAALAVGGLTPSAALTAAAVAIGLPVHAMVRLRPGGFVCDDALLALMADEIARLRDLGVAGVVVGVTQADGSPDERALARLREAAAGLRIVLHRAIDLAPDPVAAVRRAVALGYDHVLSSGGAPSAPAGAAMLRAMVDEADGRLEVIAGAGVRCGNVAALVAATGVGAVHSSASIASEWPDARIAALGFGPAERLTTDREAVSMLVAALSGSTAPRVGA